MAKSGIGYLHLRRGENLLVIYTCARVITETLDHASMIRQKTTEQVYIMVDIIVCIVSTESIINLVSHWLHLYHCHH